jgi:uncharacterized membrane protein YphA (DoxX/SURF4 family)
MRIASGGHAAFAATLIGLGILGLIKGDFAPVWEPVPSGASGRELLVYLCASISLACGAALLWQRTAGMAARVLLADLLLWMAVFRVPEALRAPAVLDAWSGCNETVVMLVGAWVLCVWFIADWDWRPLGIITGNNGLRVARVLYGLALIYFGLAHFVYLQQTAVLVPSWLPWHAAWAYLTGTTYIAAGAAVLINVRARLAAMLAAVQTGGITLLVWVPVILAPGPKSAFQWSDAILSWALTTAAWVVADSYRGMPSPASDRMLRSTRSNQDRSHVR